MIAFELPAHTVDEALRAVRALGAHRYVAGRMHLGHALVFDALLAAGEAPSALQPAFEWARATLADASIEKDSKDERLYRRMTEEELGAALDAFWRPGPRADRARARLLSRLEELGLPLAAHAPFDEAAEEDMHPVLIDAGWELHALSELDPARHRGAIEAFGESILFLAAKFEEENAAEPPTYLEELPALGGVELVRGADPEGHLRVPLTVWAEGNETYHDYVVRGVVRAAKLAPP